MLTIKSRLTLSCMLFLLVMKLLAQNKIVQGADMQYEQGLPLVVNYTPDTYQANQDNWTTVQDSSGILYFGNGVGILTFNGAEWNLLSLPNKPTILAMAKDVHGGIFAGGVKTFGYLTNDSIGQLAYVSLIEKIPIAYRDFKTIRGIYSIDNAIYFCSQETIYKWDHKNIKVINIEPSSTCYAVNNRIFVKAKGALKIILNDTLATLPNGDEIQKEQITAMAAFDENKIIIATASGLFIYNGQSFERFETNFSEFLDNNRIYDILVLFDGTMVLASFYKGILFCDLKGRENFRLTTENLLESDKAFHLFLDRSGILWTSFYQGIAKIEYPSPFSYYSEHNGTPDFIRGFCRTANGLFLASGSGLFKLDKNKVIPYNENLYFGSLTSIISHGNTLLVAGSDGLQLVEGENKTKLLGGNVHSLYKSNIDSNRIFVGRTDGLLSIYKTADTWTKEKSIVDGNKTALLIKEGKQGDLWISTYGTELIRVSYTSFDDAKHVKNPTVTILSEKHGIPISQRRYQEAFFINDELYIQSDDADVLMFDRSAEQFELDLDLKSKLHVANEHVIINGVDDYGNVWLRELENDKHIDQLVAWRQPNDTYILERLGEARIMDLVGRRPYPEIVDSVVWCRGSKGAVRHDYRKALTLSSNRAVISKVLMTTDSCLFGGFGVQRIPAIRYHQNQLRFSFASPSFYDESDNMFQYYLEGFDKNWSPWSLETKKDYTNIPEGYYTFKVRSKNVMHQISEPATYSFSIEPPWYRQWWMYVLYGLAFVGTLLWFSRWRSNKLKRKNLLLENKITERTEEIQQKNELLGQQAARLIELDTVKTQLYNNITHEFRTPLTVIQGMTESIEASLSHGQIEESNVPIEMIKRNGRKLLRLINEMLDLAKIESGNMKLQLVQADIIPYIKYLCESFHSLAEQKGINLVVYSEIESLFMDFDADKMAVIISNLLSNAIKFTPKHGKIIVHLNQLKKEADWYLSIKVKDTGTGIDAKELPHVFDKFYQVHDSRHGDSDGTGIGLALTQELIQLMNGGIQVESTKDVGTTFSIEILKTSKADLWANPANLIERDALSSIHLIPETNGESQSTSQKTSKPNLLIIEDNMDVAFYLRQCLQNLYQILHAKNGKSGIEMALEHIPDIVISDVMMPEKDGFEVCAALKSNVLTDHIPIILLTAKATVQDRLAGFSFGADAYLAKPFVKAELLSRLDQLVLQRQKLLKKFEQGSLSQMLNAHIENPETKFLQKAIRIIQQEMADASFGSVHLAQKLQLSESQVYRKLKAITDKSTAVFIRSIRLQKAREEIQLTNKTISEVAYDMGFNDPAYFSRVFKEEYGFAPSELKNKE